MGPVSVLGWKSDQSVCYDGSGTSHCARMEVRPVSRLGWKSDQSVMSMLGWKLDHHCARMEVGPVC